MPKSFLSALLFLVLQAAAAQAFEVEVLPGSVSPGDAYVVRVTGASERAVGVHEGGWLSFSSCGEGCYVAIGAVDLDAEPGDYKLSVSAGEEGGHEAFITVAPKKFPVSELWLQPDKVTLSPEDEKRVERETRMLASLWEKRAERLWEGGFVMPLENDFSTAFGVRRVMNKVKTSVHTGLDIRGRAGEPVRASNRGRVVLAEELFYGGNTVVLDHGQGIYTIYMHLSKFRAGLDEVVEKGAVVGEVGATGRATGPHLHFGVKVVKTNANPASVTKLPL